MDEESDRKLATIEEITEVRHHSNADRLDVVKVRGWRCITGRDAYKVGDKVIYFEIDSALPLSDSRFAEFGERKSRQMQSDDGTWIDVHPLKSIRLRGEVSQGMVLPLQDFPEAAGGVGDDVSADIGIQKYRSKGESRPPRSGSLSIAYPRPKFVPKTDAERIQNLSVSSIETAAGQPDAWVATEKIHGTSTSYFVDHLHGISGTTSRNLSIPVPDSDGRVAFGESMDIWVRIADEWPEADCVVIQGELAGPGLLGNTLNLPSKQFFAFRVMVNMKDVPQSQWPEWLPAVPILDVPFPSSVDEAIELADSLDSVVSPGNQPEGIVWRREGSSIANVPRCVKAISNKFLLAE